MDAGGRHGSVKYHMRLVYSARIAPNSKYLCTSRSDYSFAIAPVAGSTIVVQGWRT